MESRTLTLTLFLHADDTLMLDCCIDSATETQVGRQFGTKSVQQSSPTQNTARRVCTLTSLEDQGMGEIQWLEVHLSDKRSIFKSYQGVLRHFRRWEYELITEKKLFYRKSA